MDSLLRKFVEWKGRRRAAQVIVYDGAAEIERTKAYVKGALLGIILATVAFVIAAPSTADSAMLEEIEKQRSLVREANQRVDQAAMIADVCLNTAQEMEETLQTYHELLRTPKR